MTAFHSYTPSDGHGLAHNPFKALIAPRPIGWISTVSAEGVPNLAPYSYFNALSDAPPLLMFSSSGRKHSLENIEATGAFVHNVVSRGLADRMNQTSGSYRNGHSEFDMAGLTPVRSDIVAPPRVAEAPAAMECRLVSITRLADASGTMTDNYMIIGEVVRIHVANELIRDGVVDQAGLHLLGRLGHIHYAAVDELISLKRPVLSER